MLLGVLHEDGSLDFARDGRVRLAAKDRLIYTKLVD